MQTTEEAVAEEVRLVVAEVLPTEEVAAEGQLKVVVAEEVLS